MPRAPELLRGFGWKLAAVVLAYVLWLAAVEEPLAIRQIDVPVDFVNLGPTLAIVRDRPSSIVVRVEAREPVAKDLQPTDIRVAVDLAGLGQGKHNIRLAPDGPSIMPRRFGVKVTEVFPPALEIRLEPRLATEVPVTAVLTGAPAEGFEVGEVGVDPPVVRVEGPESEVKATAQARTREIAVDGRKAPFQQTVWIDVASPGVRIVGEARVRVSVHVAETIGEKVFSDLPVVLVHATGEVHAVPRTARVAVHGPALVLRELRREDVIAFVDLADLKPRSEEYHPVVQVDFTRDLYRERLHGRSATPPSIAVRVLPRKAARGESSRGRAGGSAP